MTQQEYEQLRDNPEAWLKVVTKDGQIRPFQMTPLQRRLWNMFHEQIKNGAHPHWTILKRPLPLWIPTPL